MTQLTASSGRKLALAALGAFLLFAVTASSADTFAVTVQSQTNSTITLAWSPQAGYGYLFSVNGAVVSRTNDAARSSVKFSKVTNGVYEIAVIVKGATGTYPSAPPPPPKNQCEDQVDNDGDGKVDFPADPGCTSATDNDETDPSQPPPPTGYPNASNTGVPAGTTLTTYTGPTNITVANTIIDSKNTGCLTVSAPGVIIRKSHVSCAGGYAVYVDDRTSTQTLVTIQDSEIECKNGPGTAVGEADVTVLRTFIHGCENGFDANQNIRVEDSFIHDLYTGGGAHTDGLQMSGHWTGSGYAGGAVNLTIRHNTIFGNGPPNDTTFGTSAIISNSGGDTNILIENNLLAGGAYTLYCEQHTRGTNYRVINNKFSTRFKSTVGYYGPVTDCQDEDASGNVYYETGLPVAEIG